MSNAITRKDIDPIVAKAIADVFTRWGAWRSVHNGWVSKAEREALDPYFGWAWFRDRSNQWATVAFIAVLIVQAAYGGLAAINSASDGIGMLLLCAASLWVTVGVWTAYVLKVSRRLIPGTMSNIIPFAKFETADERVYAEALAAIMDNPLITTSERASLIVALNEVLSTLRRLRSRRLDLSTGAGPPSLQLERETFVSASGRLVTPWPAKNLARR